MIYQISYGISYGDAVGNEIMDIDRLLKKSGFRTGILAERVSRVMSFRPEIRRLDGSFRPAESDVILYHITCGCELNRRIFEYGCRVIVRYHNITPPHYYEGYNDDLVRSCELGRAQLKEMAGKPILALAVSGFNKTDLAEAGFSCPIRVIPILKKPMKTFFRTPDPHRILAVGRIAPNKRVDMVIKAFFEYRKRFDPQARLTIAGSYKGLEKYKQELDDLCGGSSAVVFTGHITNAGLSMLYRRAGLYMTMSDHEGYCVPLVEAMEYGIPVLAASTSAIPETLGGAGVLLTDQDPEIVSEAMHRLISDPDYRNGIIDGQYRRADELSCRRVGKKMLEALKPVIKEN